MNIIAAATLLFFPLVFGLKHLKENQGAAFSRERFGYGSYIAGLILLIYLLALLICNVEELYPGVTSFRGKRIFLSLVFYLSGGLAFATFPNVAAEFLTAETRLSLLKFQKEFYQFVGWVVVISAVACTFYIVNS